MVNMAKDTENIILETARKHFVQNGFAATRMQEIADEAGINKAMLHYYFRSKNKLYREIISQTLNTIIPQLSAAIETKGTTLEKIEKLVKAYLRIFQTNPDFPFFIMSEISQKREDFIDELKKRATYFQPIQHLMMQMMQDMQDGHIRSIPPVHLLINIISMCVFPFMAKPVFCNIMEIPEDRFESLMAGRAEVIISFVNQALRVD